MPVFAGTVSAPQGIAELSIALKTPDGMFSDTPVDETGIFSLQSATQGDQFLMRADLGNNNYLYSIAHLSETTANRQNVHSYTDLIARVWFADQGLDINSVFASAAGIENFPTESEIDTIDANVQAIVSDVLQAYGLSDVLLSTADYEATDTGIDRFLNENPVIIRDNRATILVNDPQTNLQATAVNRVSLQTTFGVLDLTPPETPQDLRALGTASIVEETGELETSIVLAWAVASDNIGVATYRIFRDDILIDSTPFPSYIDDDVQVNNAYSYNIVTVDESGNISLPSLAAVGATSTFIDTTPPAIPSSSSLNGNTQSIDVFWTHADILDLARFEVTRVSDDGILVREVTRAELNDITVASGTEYCYEIVAVDASGNRSEPNPSSCITTSGATVDPVETTMIPATVEMAQTSISGPENSTVVAFVNRLGNTTGEVSIDYIISPGTAMADQDYTAADGTLVWADGDIVARQIDISLLSDGLVEGPETLTVILTNSSTDAVISNPDTTVTIVDID